MADDVSVRVSSVILKSVFTQCAYLSSSCEKMPQRFSARIGVPLHFSFSDLYCRSCACSTSSFNHHQRKQTQAIIFESSAFRFLSNCVSRYRQSQLISRIHFWTSDDVALVLHAADEYLAAVLQVKEVQHHLILHHYRVKQIRKFCRSYKQKPESLDVEGVSHGSM